MPKYSNASAQYKPDMERQSSLYVGGPVALVWAEMGKGTFHSGVSKHEPKKTLRENGMQPAGGLRAASPEC